MASVERHAYMDNQAVQALEETYRREKRIQRDYINEQVSQGNIRVKPPTPPKPTKTLTETYGLPEHLKDYQDDPELAVATQMSRSMWTSNPAYLVRNGKNMTSHTKETYTWDEEEIAFMKAQKMLDKTHNRRQDEFSRYVEARARYKNVMGASAM